MRIILILLFFIMQNPVFSFELTPEQRIFRQSILYQTGSNYIKNAYYGGGKILRWNKEEFPLKIYAENNLDVPNYYSYAFIGAANIWAKELPFIKIQFTADDTLADISFKIANEKDKIRRIKENEPTTLAYTEPVVRGNKLIKMNIYVNKKDIDNKYFEPQEILNISLHEFAHALGVTGHSNDPNSIMYALYNPKNHKISAFINREDKNTVKLLYQITPDITNGDRAKEKGNIDSKIVLGDFEERVNETIESLKKELKIKPDDAETKIQLAANYEQKGDYDNMFKYLTEAEVCVKTNEELYRVYIGYSLYYFHTKNNIQAFFYYKKAKELKK